VEQVDCGDAAGPRTIVSGLVKYFQAAQLVGRKVVVVCNLKPSKMRGVTSEGMLLAAAASVDTSSSGEERVELLSTPVDAPVGELIRVRGFGAPMPDAVLKSKTALDMWKRVCSDLVTNSNWEASYRAADNVLLTSAGPCTVDTLGHAKIG
jgi:tRNA-binding EMAP/Myf-like protein